MASPSNPQHEPTMEEILASIRKIISEDSGEPVQPPPVPSQPSMQARSAGDADVLELTQEIREEPVPAPAPVASATTADAEPAAQGDVTAFHPVEEPAPRQEPQSRGQNMGELVSDKTRQAIDLALAGLDFGPEEPSPAAPVAPVDGRSIEAVFDHAVRETFDPVLRSWLQDHADAIIERMKPAIAEWMEDHLPSMLKSAVEAEVARAVRARGKR